jgi:hypothetical protein
MSAMGIQLWSLGTAQHGTQPVGKGEWQAEIDSGAVSTFAALRTPGVILNGAAFQAEEKPSLSEAEGDLARIGVVPSEATSRDPSPG